jgi:hypothetical protein
MSSISKTDRILQVLRTSAASAPARVAARRAPPARRDTSRNGASKFDLSADIARRVEAIPADAPQRDERVARAFLESCVAQTFGAGAVSDPSFQQVVDKAHDAIRANDELAAAMERLVRQLCGA